MTEIPDWLHLLAVASLITAGACALYVLYDVLFVRPQKMAVMNWVWPITMLYFGPIGLWAYFWFGRAKPEENGKSKTKPFWQTVALGVSHCGGGCTLGDIGAEWAVFGLGATLLGSTLGASLLWDYLAAFALGIVFQYFAIAPMKNLHGWPGVVAAVKADAISLTAFEVGLFLWMALSAKVFFHPPLEPTNPVYWFQMQVGMVLGYFTSYPANWWLIRRGIKEAM